ncbi:MAG: energy transducer TonB [Burkholderiaceae bacterium]
MTSSALKQYESGNAKSRTTGWIIVVGVHALIAYALISGTARKGLDLLKKPLEAVVIQEVIIPPPPPPPPPEIKPLQPNQPKAEAPPPPFVPPPEIAAPPSAGPAIAAVTAPPETPAVIAPPPPPLVVAEAPKPPARAEIGVVCPTQVKPEMPRKALKDGTGGIVKAQVIIQNGVVKDVVILSGPRVFHSAVRDAVLQYKCLGGAGEVIAPQEFIFSVE